MIEATWLVSFLERSFRAVADEKGVAYRAVLDDSAPTEFLSDYTRVKQIAKNLLSNAIKFTDEGSVTVELSGVGDTRGGPGDRYLALTVIDTGIGIDERDHARIFESFQQAKRGSTRDYGGTGLGLAISQELAHQLGGEITLKSAPGQGSTFTCYLPVGGVTTADDADGGVLERPVASSRVQSRPVALLPLCRSRKRRAPRNWRRKRAIP